MAAEGAVGIAAAGKGEAAGVRNWGRIFLLELERAGKGDGRARGIALFDADVPFDSDLEDRDGSAFAFDVIIGNDGSVKGDCQYVMAGRTDFDGLGPQVMHNPVTDAWVNLDGSVTLYSEGSLRTWKGQVFDVEMLVTVTAGGAGACARAGPR